MYVAIALQRLAKPANSKETLVGTFFDESLDKAASAAEATCLSYRRSNGASYRYRTLVGKLTHEVIPPEEKVDIRIIDEEPLLK